MTIPGSLFLIAIGAILRYAVTDRIQDVDLTTIGLILLVIGAIGLLIGLWQEFADRRRVDEVVHRDERPVVDRTYR